MKKSELPAVVVALQVRLSAACTAAQMSWCLPAHARWPPALVASLLHHRHLKNIGCITTPVATSAPAGRWPAHLAQGPRRAPQGAVQREVLDCVGLVQPAAGRRLPG